MVTSGGSGKTWRKNGDETCTKPWGPEHFNHDRLYQANHPIALPRNKRFTSCFINARFNIVENELTSISAVFFQLLFVGSPLWLKTNRIIKLSNNTILLVRTTTVD